MMIVLFAAALAILLAISRRKIGIFIMAAASGLLLNTYWNENLTELISSAGLNIPAATLSGIIGLILILGLAIVSLGKSPKEDGWVIGIIGSLIATAFVMLIALPSFEQVFVLDGFSRDLASVLTDWSSWIVLIGVLAALMDLLVVNKRK